MGPAIRLPMENLVHVVILETPHAQPPAIATGLQGICIGARVRIKRGIRPPAQVHVAMVRSPF